MDEEPPATAMDVIVRFNSPDIEPKIFNLGKDENAYMKRLKGMLT